MAAAKKPLWLQKVRLAPVGWSCCHPQHQGRRQHVEACPPARVQHEEEQRVAEMLSAHKKLEEE